MRNPSPFRYPGGKVSLTRVIESVLYDNRLQGGVYVEPYAGGAGAGLKLLLEGHVNKIVINDADRSIYSFWNSAVKRSTDLIRLIKTTPLTITEWKRQRAIYRQPGRRCQVEVGFAAFYLNRCNRSGIIKNAGPIGGIEQSGKWKLDARFNRKELIERVEQIEALSDRITVTNLDALSLFKNLERYTDKQQSLVYADPPYYVKGRELYLNHYGSKDHELLARQLCGSVQNWILTYDDHPEIRRLYATTQIIPFRLRYSAHHDSEEGGEVLAAPLSVIISDRTKQLLGTRSRCARSKAA